MASKDDYEGFEEEEEHDSLSIDWLAQLEEMDVCGSGLEAFRRQLEAEAAQVHPDFDGLRKQQAAFAREQEREVANRVNHFPPGINVFRRKPLQRFRRNTLDLVTDFGYELEHLQRGFSTPECMESALKHPLSLIMFLSPETTSKLIEDKHDFRAICDFLFFSLAGFSDPLEDQDDYDLLRKALFDLLRNYGFDSWSLSLQHVYTALVNLGADQDLLSAPKFCPKEISDHPLLQKRAEDIGREHMQVYCMDMDTTEAQWHVELVARFLELVQDLIATFSTKDLSKNVL